MSTLTKEIANSLRISKKTGISEFRLNVLLNLKERDGLNLISNEKAELLYKSSPEGSQNKILGNYAWNDFLTNELKICKTVSEVKKIFFNSPINSQSHFEALRKWINLSRDDVENSLKLPNIIHIYNQALLDSDAELFALQQWIDLIHQAIIQSTSVAEAIFCCANAPKNSMMDHLASKKWQELARTKDEIDLAIKHVPLFSFTQYLAFEKRINLTNELKEFRQLYRLVSTRPLKMLVRERWNEKWLEKFESISSIHEIKELIEFLPNNSILLEKIFDVWLKLASSTNELSDLFNSSLIGSSTEKIVLDKLCKL